MWLTSEPTVWMPTQASNHAAMVDNLYYFLYWVSVVSFVAIVVLIAVFVVKYKYKGDKNERAESQNDHGTTLEIAWSLPIAVLSALWFYFGAVGFIDMRTPPEDAYEIQVTAYKWAWEFRYPNGAVDNNLHIPTDRPVRLLMAADDVLHSFFVPAFRVKQDLVPGRYTDVWFQAEPGEYQGFCTEYCGTKHSDMLFKVIAYESGGFEKWLDESGDIVGNAASPEAAGEILVNRRGCLQCHSLDGSKAIGPSFKGSYGTMQNFADGSSAKIDENYIKNSILQPQSQVVAGYPPAMPTFQGKLKDKEIDAIISYLKSLK